MAQQFKKAASCSICLRYFEDPVKLRCSFTCCRRCLPALPTAPDGEGLLCSNCSRVSRKEDIKPHRVLCSLASKIKEMEPQLTSLLQMDPRIRKFQVDVTLDLDTAHDYLVISEDLRRVRIGGDSQERPAHPGRFSDSPCVLGAPRFTSGRHYWEVDVAGSRTWSVGLCREAASRQGDVVLSDERGFWTVICSGGRFVAGTQHPRGLLVQPRLRRLGLFLDVDVGTLSFYHVADGSHVFTFPGVPAAEPLRPFLGPAGSSEDGESWLAICPCAPVPAGLGSLGRGPGLESGDEEALSSGSRAPGPGLESGGGEGDREALSSGSRTRAPCARAPLWPRARPVAAAEGGAPARPPE
ncbi:unnamed protein product [Pipistrellus nathusii]|uniref:B30.2/SPRY domain-containing protein n=1 Tax=Pipistrellus nathusii TaxID=59473 RepID=A0ABN9ZGQ7_PIPNA